MIKTMDAADDKWKEFNRLKEELDAISQEQSSLATEHYRAQVKLEDELRRVQSRPRQLKEM